MTWGNRWQLMGRTRRVLMLAGTAAVLAGAGLGIRDFVEVARTGTGGNQLLPALMFLPLCGGWVVLGTALARSHERIRFFRDWSHHPPSGRVLWLTGFGLIAVYLAAVAMDQDGLRALLGAFAFPFQGICFTLLGWGSMLMSTAASHRRFKAGEAQPQPDGASGSG